MGLNVVVGFAEELEDDEEGQRLFVEECARVSAALERSGLPTWVEPAGVESQSYELYGYSGLHALRRIAAHLRTHGQLPAPLGADADAAGDETLLAAYAAGPAFRIEARKRLWRFKVQTHGGPAAGCFDHLINHSDAEGFYVPVDFAPILVDETVTGESVGSVHRLLAECLELAALLGVDPGLDPESDEVLEAVDEEIADRQGWKRYAAESSTCLQLIGAAQRSIATGAAIVFA